MYHDHTSDFMDAETLANLGADAVAYMREMSAKDILDMFPDVFGLEEGRNYWALFAANGDPIVLADDPVEVFSSAFYNDLKPVKPN